MSTIAFFSWDCYENLVGPLNPESHLSPTRSIPPVSEQIFTLTCMHTLHTYMHTHAHTRHVRTHPQNAPRTHPLFSLVPKPFPILPKSFKGPAQMLLLQDVSSRLARALAFLDDTTPSPFGVGGLTPPLSVLPRLEWASMTHVSPYPFISYIYVL